MPLQARWYLNETSGLLAPDSSVNGNDGVLDASPATPLWIADGRDGTECLLFDGIQDGVTVADSGTLRFASDFTVEAWVYDTLGDNSNWRTVAMRNNSGGNEMSWALYAKDAQPSPGFYLSVGGFTFSAAFNTPLPLNTWTHLAATYDGLTYRLYTNGVADGVFTTSGGPIDNTNGDATTLGQNVRWGEPFQGRIDSVLLWDEVRSAAQILSDMDDSGGGATGVTGSGAIAEARDTLAGAGSSDVVGSGVLAEGGDTLAGAGQVDVVGAGGVFTFRDTLAAAGAVEVSGSGAIVEGADTAAGAGVVEVSGVGAIAENGDTLAGVGEVTPPDNPTGAGAIVEATDTLAGAGAVIVSGLGAFSEGSDVVAGVGTVAGLAGAGALVERPDIVAGVGLVTPLPGITGVGALIERGDILMARSQEIPMPSRAAVDVREEMLASLDYSEGSEHAVDCQWDGNPETFGGVLREVSNDIGADRRNLWTLECRLIDVPGINVNDFITVGGGTFRIVGRNPDGFEYMHMILKPG